MSDEVKPALTAEEWTHPYTGVVDTRQDLRYRIGRGDGESHPAMRHQAAAIALHGQPFGFTREDVQILRECSKQQRDIEGDPEAIAYAGSLDYGTELESLAARIEALLPPEDTE